MKKPFFRRFTKKVFIIVNIITGIFFILGSIVKYIDPERWWFLSLFTLLLPYLLFLLVIFIVFWLIVRPGWSLISIITLLLSLHSVKQIFPLNFTGFTSEKKPGDIRIMSWNVEFFSLLQHKKNPGRRQQMFDLINQYNPDIACFQEVVAGENKTAINYLPDILDSLKFKNYLYSYTLRDDFDKDHHFGILVVSKFPIVKKQTVVNNPDDYNSTYQFIDVVINTDTVRVFNIHLQSLRFSTENKDYMEKGPTGNENNISESKSIINKIKTGIQKRASQAYFLKDEMDHSPYPVIVCGDFNDVPVSYAYETIGRDLQNAFVKKGFGISRTYSSISPTLRIDNIFVDHHFQVQQVKRLVPDLSDHFPIIADVTLLEAPEDSIPSVKKEK